ncbi:MAG: queuosine precursor transporter [Deltaproteobacteria bacterium]|nr:queuosine precursor transporter [Deltaproteobacteria bacterium]MBW2138269.1 queuosine precursor transporter [Deltaproteobacteria bacterium]
MFDRNQPEPERKGPGAPFSRRFVLLVALFVTCLITSNITAVKVIRIWGVVLPAAIFIFPFSYILGDVLTEVYGYRIARQVIWLGFLCNLIAVLGIWIGQIVPPAPFWDGQAAYERILGYTPRILAASFLAYLMGEFANAYVLAKMKVATKGRWLWSRTIGSTLVGQGLDSALFIGIAFWGEMPQRALLLAIVAQWLSKSVYEAAATPLTYAIVNYLKRRDGVDVFDYETHFHPLRFLE